MNAVGLIMAGGQSTRMRAGGCSTHKALRIVRGFSLLEHNLRNMLRFGVRDIRVAISDSELELSAWLSSKKMELARTTGIEFEILREETPLGTIGVARQLAALGQNVVVVNVDNLCDLDLRGLLEFHIMESAALTIATHDEMFRIPFGQIKKHHERLIEYREKPSLAVTISSGIYVLHPRAMHHIPASDRTDVPMLVTRLVDCGELVACYQHATSWIDVNDEDTLAEAEVLYAAKAV
jgi:NDP-sugar pyrophosphorylase family protein